MSMFNAIRNWWESRTKMYILLRPRTSEVMISKRLYETVLSDHTADTNINVLFTRIKADPDKLSVARSYAMFFNPDWSKHGVSDPRHIMTIPVTVGKLGHVGFQAIQPSAEEILTMYGINHTDDDDKWHRINVTRESLNDEPYYLLKRP